MEDDSYPSVESIHKEKLSKLGRRSFVKTLVGLGMSGGVASYLTSDDVTAAADDQIPIPRAIVYDEATEKYKPEIIRVPSDWYNDIQHAHNVYSKENFSYRDGVSGTTVKPGKYDGRSAIIEVQLSTPEIEQMSVELDDVRGSIPESVEGVPIEVVKTGKAKLGYYDGDYGDSPPSGVTCTSSDGGTGTLGGYMTKNGNDYFVTNHHLFDPGSAVGKKLYQGTGPAIGEVVESDCYEDFVAVIPQNGHSATREIVDSSLYTNGHYTGVGIDNLAAADKFLWKKGDRTGMTLGKVHGRGDDTVYNSNCNLRHDQVKWGLSEAFDKGDSGSIAYRTDDDETALVAALNAAFTSYWEPDDHVFGTGAYKIYTKYGYGW